MQFRFCQPWYDSGELRHLDTLTPPWPAFLLATSTSSLSKLTPELISTLLNTITQLTSSFKTGGASTIAHLTAAPFNYKPEDADKWLGMTEWSKAAGEIDGKAIDLTVEVLKKAGVVKGEVAKQSWLAEGVAKYV